MTTMREGQVADLMTVKGADLTGTHISVRVFRHLSTTVPRVLDPGRGRRRQHEPIKQERMRVPLPAMGSCAVDDRTVRHVEHNHT